MNEKNESIQKRAKVCFGLFLWAKLQMAVCDCGREGRIIYKWDEEEAGERERERAGELEK